MDQFRNIIAHVRGQFWLVPLMVLMAAAGLAWLLLTRGHRIGPEDATGLWWLYSGEAATARDLLASLLSGLMTMSALVVSITFVILTLAANQLGPRLITIFMRDLQIQGVIGLFFGTILYIILIMRTLDDTLGQDGVPHLAITTATLLSILCLLSLLFYLHKVARLIIADNVVNVVAKSLCETFADILPKPSVARDRANEPHYITGEFPSSWPICLEKAGYLQVIDYDDLASLARETGIRIDVDVRAGQHLLRGGEHLTVHAANPLDGDVVTQIRQAFTIGDMRTPAQDPEQGIRELVEIATRALSPGINDAFTAFAVIDQLSTALEVALERGRQQRVYADEDGTVRLVASRADLGDMLGTAFDPIRHAGQGNPQVLGHLADALRKLSTSARTASDRKALSDQLDQMLETAALGEVAARDRSETFRHIQLARQAFAGAADPEGHSG